MHGAVLPLYSTNAAAGCECICAKNPKKLNVGLVKSDIYVEGLVGTSGASPVTTTDGHR